MGFEITKLSSKGQVVIPGEIREKLRLREGENLVVSAKDNVIMIKRIKNPMTAEDIRTLNEIKEAWEEIERGEFTRMKSKDFLAEISKW